MTLRQKDCSNKEQQKAEEQVRKWIWKRTLALGSWASKGGGKQNRGNGIGVIVEMRMINDVHFAKTC